jgi:hypothetical protein
MKHGQRQNQQQRQYCGENRIQHASEQRTGQHVSVLQQRIEIARFGLRGDLELIKAMHVTANIGIYHVNENKYKRPRERKEVKERKKEKK